MIMFLFDRSLSQSNLFDISFLFLCFFLLQAILRVLYFWILDHCINFFYWSLHQTQYNFDQSGPGGIWTLMFPSNSSSLWRGSHRIIKSYLGKGWLTSWVQPPLSPFFTTGNYGMKSRLFWIIVGKNLSNPLSFFIAMLRVQNESISKAKAKRENRCDVHPTFRISSVSPCRH